MDWTHCLVRDGDVLVARVAVAQSFLSRMRGLLGIPCLGSDEALYISPCSAIHTIGMRFPIDLAFLDSAMTVCRTVGGVGPGRFVLGGKRAAGVLEAAAGWITGKDVKRGDRLSLRRF